MKTRAFCLAAACTLASMATATHAQTPKLQPGLWQHAFTLKSQSGQVEQMMKQAQEQLAMLSPSDRKAVEDMMAAKGIGLSANGSSVKICITKEDAERGEVPQPSPDCKQEVVSRSATSIKLKFSCNSTPPSSGEGEVTVLSPTSYVGKAVVDTTVAGQPERMNMDQTGTWLSADCGTIKPLGH